MNRSTWIAALGAFGAANSGACDKPDTSVSVKTEAFMKAAKAPVHIPLSGMTMEFDAAGKCAAGC